MSGLVAGLFVIVAFSAPIGIILGFLLFAATRTVRESDAPAVVASYQPMVILTARAKAAAAVKPPVESPAPVVADTRAAA